MKNILVLGAGLSATALIDYLLGKSDDYHWAIRLGDISEELAQKKINNHGAGTAFYFDVNNEEQLNTEVSLADVVVSMLPALFHPLVAKTCVKHRKHMVTASYVSADMAALHQEAVKKDVLLLNEIGVDPGIDHMSAMRIIHRIQNNNGRVLGFRSSTGGLIAPMADNNPWHYKFTWNPRNVVLAGQGVSKYLEEGCVRYVPYHRLFDRLSRVKVKDVGIFEMYPNRDSMHYQTLYGLEEVQSLIRGTLRQPGFCASWNVFVQLGLTDDSYEIDHLQNSVWCDFVGSFLPYNLTLSVEERLAEYCHLDLNGEEMKRLKWLGIFDNIPLDVEKASPASVLQKLLLKRWKLDPSDRDMIVMQHEVDYEMEGQQARIVSSMKIEGKDKEHTAMAITVGTPVAIAVKLLLTGKITSRGVQVPVHADIYNIVLDELEQAGVRFVEEESILHTEDSNGMKS